MLVPDDLDFRYTNIIKVLKNLSAKGSLYSDAKKHNDSNLLQQLWMTNRSIFATYGNEEI